MTNDLETKRANLKSGLTSTVKQLEATGNRVVLVQDVPYFASPYSSDPRQFSALEIASGRDLGSQMPRDFADKNQQAARTAVTSVAQITGAAVLDVREFFCPKNICRTQIGETYLYRDDGHISIAAAKLLEPLFQKILA
ncbi:unannotated protein [freshwater metagenome]|uniref:Unannotated protein n=1 Tax=freshwater metagenome TaxID=449393 RepID=A0A6J7SQT2_9ZZZZ